ncbi:cytochrome c oxidase assembly protein COX18, mitochondrial [Hyalella azteca]|uniref:Cytochrome c oxidase assembly protein COX18, mitochondrial n=1 Tax=Hyalella azteca TaxID=294128 RepID=A0A8B7NJ62_HYAAZ|nr:cytochrome c oxidase assembly protein COX18, mitochondrial [Hyalella azteca]
MASLYIGSCRNNLLQFRPCGHLALSRLHASFSSLCTSSVEISLYSTKTRVSYSSQSVVSSKTTLMQGYHLLNVSALPIQKQEVFYSSIPTYIDPLESNINSESLSTLKCTLNSVEISNASTQIPSSIKTPQNLTATGDYNGVLNHENQTSFLDTIIPTVSAATEAASNSSSELTGWLATYVKWFESLASSAPVMKLMVWLQDIHSALGVPWWMSIILTTVVLRTSITLPLALYQQYVFAKVELLKGEMVTVMQRLADETRAAKRKFAWDEAKTRLHFRRRCKESWNELIVRDNCHPGKGVVLLLGQLPLWIMISVAFRNLALCPPQSDYAAMAAQQELSLEGLPWCTDLTVSDSLMILPFSMAIINLIITEVHVLQRPAVAVSTGVRVMTWVFRGVAVITVPIAMFMPSAVVLYWVTSSSCALAQAFVLMHPRLRRACGIPQTPSEMQRPYSEIAQRLALKIKGEPKANDKPVILDTRIPEQRLAFKIKGKPEVNEKPVTFALKDKKMKKKS